MENSLFNKIPTELRLSIFEFAIGSNRLQIDYGPKGIEWKRNWPVIKEKDSCHALLVVCKQIRSEVVPIFYRSLDLRYDPITFQLMSPRNTRPLPHIYLPFVRELHGEHNTDVWLRSLLGFLDHIGAEGRKNLGAIELWLGSSELAVFLELGHLVDKLSLDLARLLKLLGPRTKVTLRFNIEIGGHFVRAFWLDISDVRVARVRLYHRRRLELHAPPRMAFTPRPTDDELLAEVQRSFRRPTDKEWRAEVLRDFSIALDLLERIERHTLMLEGIEVMIEGHDMVEVVRDRWLKYQGASDTRMLLS